MAGGAQLPAIPLSRHRRPPLNRLVSVAPGPDWSAGGQEREGQGMFLWTRRYLSSAVVVLVVLASAAAAGAAAQSPRGVAAAQRAVAKPSGDPVDAVAHDVSPPLVDMVADSSSDT